MKWMQRLLCLMIFILNVAHASEFFAKVDRDEISKDESFQLFLTAEGEVSGDPNVSALQKDFYVYGTARSHQFTMVNGKTESKTIWVISLLPKRTGALIIPAFKMGGFSTQPLAIKVGAATGKTAAPPPQKSIFLTASLSPSETYEQSQALYIVKLYFSVNLNDASLTSPEVETATVETMGNDITYRTNKNGKLYQVLERRYLILPNQPGKFSITPPVLTATISAADPNDSLWEQFANQSQQRLIHLKAPSYEINVLPKPAGITQWFPAERVTMKEAWSSDLQDPQVGQPITRTITLTAQGAKAERIPEIVLNSRSEWKAYADKPILDNEFNDNGLLGRRIEKIAYIPQQSGALTLPALQLSWWNIKTKQLETIQLPEKTITVASGGVQPASPPPTATIIPQTIAPAVTTNEKPISKAWGITAGIFLLWVLTMMVWWRQKRPVIETEHPIHHQTSLKQARRMIKRACRDKNPAALRPALIAWAKHRWTHSNIQNLSDISQLCHNSPLQSAIEQLNAALYKAEGQAWQNDAFWKAFVATDRQKPKRSPNQNDSLPPLYL